jgi:acyl-CoA thioesterase 8
MGESENGSRATLVRPRPLDPKKSTIENVLELTALTAIGPVSLPHPHPQPSSPSSPSRQQLTLPPQQDIFTNTRPLWHPPGARGIYGGAVIAQCLAAAQLTVPAHFTIHSMHCYFVLAGDSTLPFLYHVEHVREGKSFATRTVQARQRGQPIFTTTLSFMRDKSGGKKTVQHAVPLPTGIKVPEEDRGAPYEDREKLEQVSGGSPFESRRIKIFNAGSGEVHSKRTRQWIRVRGRISEAGGHEAHLSALAYMSDSYFIGTVSRIHQLWRFSPFAPGTRSEAEIAARRELIRAEGFGDDVENVKGRPEVGMMVSLDHSIYFHDPKGFRADEWIFTEMESPWAGDGRGVVSQKMWGADGRLIATCFQEVDLFSIFPCVFGFFVSIGCGKLT